MIDKNQKVTIKWLTRNKKKFESLGYHCEGINTLLIIPVYDLPENSNVHVSVQCDVCGNTISTPYRNYNSIIAKRGEYRCRRCNAPYVSDIRRNSNKERQLDYFNSRITELGYTPIADIDSYKGYNTPLSFKCPKHGTQQLSINQLRQGCVCPECGSESRSIFHKLNKQEIMNKVSQKNNDTLLNPDDYVNIQTNNMRIKCGSCGNEFLTSIASLCNGNGYCPQCAIKFSTDTRRLSRQELIKRTTINGKSYLINPDDYTDCYNRNLKFSCVKCGDYFYRSLQHWVEGDGRCVVCNKTMSNGEYMIKTVLDKYHIDYNPQHRFPNCRNVKPLPFDFYLPDYNCCIEFDGIYHYEENPQIENGLENVKYRDSIKTKYCKVRGIKLIRIPYWEKENIEQIIILELGIIQLEDIV